MIVFMQCIRNDGWRSSPLGSTEQAATVLGEVCSALDPKTCCTCPMSSSLHAPSISTPPIHISHTMHVRTPPIQSLYPSHPTADKAAPLATLTDQRDFEQFAISFSDRTSDYISTSLPPAHTMSRSAALLFKRISAIARPPVFAATKAPVRSFSSTIGKSL